MYGCSRVIPRGAPARQSATAMCQMQLGQGRYLSNRLKEIAAEEAAERMESYRLLGYDMDY